MSSSEFNGLTEITVAVGRPAWSTLPAGRPGDPGLRRRGRRRTPRARRSSRCCSSRPATSPSPTPSRTNQFGEVGLAAGTHAAAAADRGRPSRLAPRRSPRPPTTPLAASCSTTASSTNFLSAANSGLDAAVRLPDRTRSGSVPPRRSPRRSIVDFRNNVVEAQPDARPVTGAPVDVRERPHRGARAAVGGDLKVASFNVLNYFTTLGADDRRLHVVQRPHRRPGHGQRRLRRRAARGTRTTCSASRTRSSPRSTRSTPTSSACWRSRTRRVVDGVADEALGTLVDALNAAAGSDVVGVRAVVDRAAAGRRDGRHHQRDHLPAGRRRAHRRRRARSAPRAATARRSATRASRSARCSRRSAAASRSSSSSTTSSRRARRVRGRATPTPATARAPRTSRASRQADGAARLGADRPGRRRGRSRSSATSTPTRSRTRCRCCTTPGYADAATALADGQYSYSFGGLSGSLDHVLLNDAALRAGDRRGHLEDQRRGVDRARVQPVQLPRHALLRAGPVPLLRPRPGDRRPRCAGAATGPIDLTLLDINDFHGRIDANTVKFAGTVEKREGGRHRGRRPGRVRRRPVTTSAPRCSPRRSQQDQPTIDVLNALDLRRVGGRQPRVRQGLRTTSPTA